MPAALAAGLGCALALVVVDWQVLPQNWLLAWLTYHMILSIGRYLLVRSFQSHQTDHLYRANAGTAHF